MKIGHTDDDIRTSYRLLYRKLSDAAIDELSPGVGQTRSAARSLRRRRLHR